MHCNALSQLLFNDYVGLCLFVQSVICVSLSILGGQVSDNFSISQSRHFCIAFGSINLSVPRLELVTVLTLQITERLDIRSAVFQTVVNLTNIHTTSSPLNTADHGVKGVLTP